MTDGEYDVAKSATETALRCARIAAAAQVVAAISQASRGSATATSGFISEDEKQAFEAATVLLRCELLAGAKELRSHANHLPS